MKGDPGALGVETTSTVNGFNQIVLSRRRSGANSTVKGGIPRSNPGGFSKRGNMILFIQVVSLFIGIWVTFVNIANAAQGNSVSWKNMAVMSAALTALIAVSYLI